jgi:hypothetical protein
MGIWKPISSCRGSCDCRSYPQTSARPKKDKHSSSPNPTNFYITQTHSVGKWIVAMVVYPDAKNYEGRKIMVYKAQIGRLINQTNLDPHFCEHKTCLSPFARFEPTTEGWNAAIKLITILDGQ